MNSKTLQYTRIVGPQTALVTAVKLKVSELFRRSKIEQARAGYKLRFEQQARKGSHRDIVNDLPIEEKLRLGMYRFID